tara:strand:+ start:34013 stop:34414 length:402 start_codon:yes stop_codon:yes gene_type:complete
MSKKNYEPSKDQEYMSDEMVNHFKVILEEEGTKLHTLIHTNHEVATQLNNEVDPIDQASVENERSLGAVNRDRDISKLKAVKKAIAKMPEGDFGYCDDCGDEIGVKRLSINPSLPLCFDCADIKERKAHQYAK